MGSGAHIAQGHLSRPRPPVWSQGKQKCLGEAWPAASFADEGGVCSQDQGPGRFSLRSARRHTLPPPGTSRSTCWARAGEHSPPKGSCPVSHSVKKTGVLWRLSPPEPSLGAVVIRDPLDENGLTLCLSWHLAWVKEGWLFLWCWHCQLATLQVQFCKKPGLQAVSPSTEGGRLMCAYTPIFYQLSKSNGQKRDQ